MSILRKMSSDEFRKYLEWAIKNYATEKVVTGVWSKEEALQKSQLQYYKMLPKGIDTENNHFFTVINEENKGIGMVWICVGESNPHTSFIYDINIEKEYQGNGYGVLAMEEVEKYAKSLGVNTISLHVFGNNKKAIGLYEKLNYEPVNILMKKKI